MLIDNTNFLRNKFRNIYDAFNDYRPKEYENKIEMINSVNECPTLMLKKDNDFICIHSRYNPIEEAELIIKEYEAVMQNYKHILFVGVGLGYIIEAFTKLYSNKEFSIYEPIEDTFNKYISLKKIENKNLTNLCVGQNKEEIAQFLNNVLQQTEKGLLFLYLPSYKRLFPKEYDFFSGELNLAVKRKRALLATNASFQKNWVSNSIYNFKTTLNTPDIFIENPDRFKGKTGIIVAAGPSLDFEIENLKYIKQNNMAFIFSVSSATNAMIKNNIEPHAVLSYDPGQGNMIGVFRKIIDENDDKFPLIFGTSIYSDIVKEYRGPMAHMITEQDTISQYYLQNTDGKKFEKVNDAPSIAVLALELLYKLGCSKIILVGQNLSYYKGQNYSSDMDKERNINIDLNSNSIIKLKDVYGNEVESSITYISAKEQMEAYIKIFNKKIEIINTTKYGAAIEGTTFKNLDEIIEEDLKKDDIDVNFYHQKNTDYDIEYLKSKQEAMNKNYKEYNSIIKDIESTLYKMTTVVRNNNFKQLEHSYSSLNILYNKLTENDFFTVFVYPVVRVSWQYFSDKIKDISPRTSQLKRADIIINEYRRFIFVCKKAIKETVEDLYKHLNETIDNKIEQSK